MMSRDDAEAVKRTYKELIRREFAKTKWDEWDENMYRLEYLLDKELVQEVEVQIYKFSQGKVKIDGEKGLTLGLVEDLFQSVNGICELWQDRETDTLHDRNRYLLQNFMTMAFLKWIWVGDK